MHAERPACSAASHRVASGHERGPLPSEWEKLGEGTLREQKHRLHGSYE